MLILTRTPSESIIIGKNAEIKITVLKISGKQVRIGIKAARDLPVHREEIYKRIYNNSDNNEQKVEIII